MKKSLLLAAVATIIGTVATNAQETDSQLGTIYVVPVKADGTANKLADGTYEGQVPLGTNPGETGVTAVNVEIEGGVIFYAMSTDGGMNTLYGMPSWATKPAIVGLENPLCIAGRIEGFYAQVEPGTYDITFYRMSGYNYFKIVSSASPEAIVYPSEIYLMPDSNYENAIALAGSDGEYSASVVLPETFRVSYEKSDLPVFIYGPATTDAVLVNKQPMSLALRENTNKSITYASDGGLRSGDKVTVMVDIRPGSESILVTKKNPTGIDEAAVQESDAPAQYYDLSGCLLPAEPEAPGLYIMRRGDKAVKLAIQ